MQAETLIYNMGLLFKIVIIMEKIDISQFQGFLVGQVITAFIGTVMLATGDFAGYYYMNYYSGYESYGYIYLGSGFLTTILILSGMAGLVISLHAAIKSLKENATGEQLKQNARRTIVCAGYTTILAALGGFIFAISNILDETDWWLDFGFYGAFVGGLLTVFFGKQIYDRVKNLGY